MESRRPHTRPLAFLVGLLLAVLAPDAPAPRAVSASGSPPAQEAGSGSKNWVRLSHDSTVGEMSPPQPGIRSDCGRLLFNSDTTYEGAIAWQYGGTVPPDYGAFAEGYFGENDVCAVVLDLTQIGAFAGQTADIYVWDDAFGLPGAVLCAQFGVVPGPIAFWPSMSRHVFELPDPCRTGEAWWVGYWGNWPGMGSGWFVGDDLDGFGGYPMTKIAPGLGFPTGWQNVSGAWGPIQAIGIGAEVLATPGGSTWLVLPDGTGDFPTIQAAFDSELVAYGDTIELADGVFVGPGNRGIRFRGKAVTLRSQSGNPTDCVIDCERVGTGIWFNNGEGPDSVLEGVGIVNGETTGNGGGIYCGAFTSPTIRDCVIAGNRCGNSGGGVYARHPSGPFLEGCLITGNSAGYGGGVFARSPTLESSTVSGNFADHRGGGLAVGTSGAVIERVIVWGNCVDPQEGEGDEIFVYSGGNRLTFRCSLVDSAGVEGYSSPTYEEDTIFIDPLFCSPDVCESAPSVLGNYGLSVYSPCLGISSPCGRRIGARGSECETVLVGACCLDPGSCELLSDLECAAEPGSSYLGDGTSCEPDPCSASGAEETWDLRSEIALSVPTPNPADSEVRFEFQLPRAALVRLDVIDVSGQRVRALIDGRRSAGAHPSAWDLTSDRGRAVVRGVYYLRLRAEGRETTRKLVVE